MHNSSSFISIWARLSTRTILFTKRLNKEQYKACFVGMTWILTTLCAQHSFAMDTIVVTAPRYTPFCTGIACSQALDDLAKALKSTSPFQTKPGERMDPVEIPVTQEQLCRAIKARQPAGCTTKPIIVGVNGGMPNGCGVGGMTDFFLRQALSQTYGSVFTGDLNRPMLNVNFRIGCDAHDECYGRQGGFDGCNSAMTTAIQSACATAANIATCSSMAGLYTGAIGSDQARANYANDGAAIQCLKYQNDLARNGCGQ